MKMKSSRNRKIPLSFIDKGKFCISRGFFTSNSIRENKIVAKLSESTVHQVAEASFHYENFLLYKFYMLRRKILY